MRFVLDNNVDDLFLDFTDAVHDGEGGGASQRVDLIPCGSDVDLTEENKAYFVDCVCEWRLFTSIKLQCEALCRGFHAAVPPHIAMQLSQLIQPADLARVLAGEPQIDTDDWEMHSSYAGGLRVGDRVCRWFWRALRSFSPIEQEQRLNYCLLLLILTTHYYPLLATYYYPLLPTTCCLRSSRSSVSITASYYHALLTTTYSTSTTHYYSLLTMEQEQLLQFVTGSRRPPVGGFAHLEGFNGGVHRFTLYASAEALDSLPRAHACICTIDVPKYSSYRVLRRSMYTALSMGSVGFDDAAIAGNGADDERQEGQEARA